MAARRGRATRLALAWSLGSVVIATLAVALGLWLVDLLQYEGHCAGSLLPFVGDAQPRACSFSEYFDRNGLFTLDPSAVPLAWYSGMMHYQSGRLHLATESFIAATQDHPFHLYSLNNAAVCLAQSNNGSVVDHYRQRADRIAAVRSRR